MTNLPGILLWIIYKLWTYYRPDDALALFYHATDISSLIAGFSFTMMGILATIITLIFALADRERYQRYQRRGLSDIFFAAYFIAIFELLITALLSLTGLSDNQPYPLFITTLVLFVNCATQTTLIITIIINLTRQSDNHE